MRTLAIALVTALIAVTGAAFDTPHIDYVKPFRLLALSGAAAEITVFGIFPMATEGHPDRSEYEHWFIRRVGETPWQECSLSALPCAMNGWTGGIEKFKLSAPLIAKAGLLEMKVHEGLVSMSDDSNIIRIPVLDAFGAPPTIVSISKTNFATGGGDAELTFRIAANNFDPGNVRVGFRDDPDVIYPARVYEGTTIEVKIPDKFRNHEGEIPIFLRTDKGGDSDVKYIKMVKAPVMLMIPSTPAPAPKPATTAGAVAMAPMAISPDAALGSRVRRAITQQLGVDVSRSIRVSAADGVVTIAGQVAPQMQQRITAIASSVADVKSVKWGQ